MSKTKIGKIEEGITISARGSRSGKSKYPFKQMKINASFAVDLPPKEAEVRENIERLAQTVRAASRRYGKWTGKKFAVRKTATGVRCFRSE